MLFQVDPIVWKEDIESVKIESHRSSRDLFLLLCVCARARVCVCVCVVFLVLSYEDIGMKKMTVLMIEATRLCLDVVGRCCNFLYPYP